MGGHENLLVWKKSMELARDIYEATSDFPQHELYGLAQQLRRAAVSVPSNVAGYVADKTSNHLLNSAAEVGRMLTGLRDWSGASKKT